MKHLQENREHQGPLKHTNNFKKEEKYNEKI